MGRVTKSILSIKQLFKILPPTEWCIFFLCMTVIAFGSFIQYNEYHYFTSTGWLSNDMNLWDILDEMYRHQEAKVARIKDLEETVKALESKIYNTPIEFIDFPSKINKYKNAETLGRIRDLEETVKALESKIYNTPIELISKTNKREDVEMLELARKELAGVMKELKLKQALYTFLPMKIGFVICVILVMAFLWTL